MTNVTTPLNHPPSPGLTVVIGETIKNILQTAIAIGIVGVLFFKILFVFHWDLFGILSAGWFVPIRSIFIDLRTLEIVAKALAYSAGIDLAFMLLTPGPDEAIEPLILGLASAILFSISNIGIGTDIRLAVEIGLYVIILASLFFLKSLFIKEQIQTKHPLLIPLETRVKSFADRLIKLLNH